jgi:radical S-adenosyl methionine domain-containing protein 2
MKPNKITISGYAGTGKSTVGKMLAEKLNYEFLSVGNFTREFAENEFGLSINEFQEKCKKEPLLDDYVNFRFRDICNSRENFVADFRLGFYFVKNSLNILFTLSEQEAFERLSKAGRRKEQTDFESIRKRNENMQRRFIEKFGVDFADEKNYDLVIDTSERTPFEITEQILAATRLDIEMLRELNNYLQRK